MSLSVFNRQSMYTTACRSISGIASAGIRSGKYSFHPQTPNSSLSLSSSLFSKSIISNNNNNTQVRYLNLHEYQSKDLMSKYGIRVQKGKVANNPTEAESIAKELLSAGAKELIVKAQIHAGGRGKGKFDNGFKGGVKITTVPSEVRDYSSNMLGAKLITHQTTAEGQPVHKVLVHEGIFFDRELYFAILMDRKAGGPVIVCSPQGGVDIEEVAAKTPDKIYYQPVDINKGIQSEHTDRLATLLGFTGQSHKDAQEQMVRLYNLFIGTDATQVEINPFVQTKDGYVYCVDAKINFDDNASFRHKELFALRDTSQEDPRDVVASDFGLNYIGLDGNIACMVNGAGLAMATMDIIKLHGGEPANFLDVGGGANEKQVEEAFKLLTSDQSVKAILVNIFGGIMKCDIIATGIINAARNLKLTVPLVVRLEGTNVEKGNQLLQASGLTIITAKDLDDAAIKAVKSVKPGMSKYQTMTSMPSMQRRFFSTHSAKGKKMKNTSKWDSSTVEQLHALIEEGCSVDYQLALSGAKKAEMINENDPIAQMKKDLTDDKFSLRAFMEEKYYNPKYHILLSHAALSRNELSIVLFFEHFLILCGFFNEENTHNLMEINVNTELYYNKEKINAEIDLRLLYKIPSHKFSFRYMMLVLALEAKNVPSMENAVETKKMSAQVTGEMLAAAQHDLLTALPSHLGLTQSGCLVSDAWRNALKKVKASVVVWGVTCRKTPGMDADIFVQIYRAKISAEDVLNLYDGAPLTPNHEILESVVYQFFEESSRMSLLDTMHQVRENIRSQPIPIMAEVDGKTLIGKDAMNAILKQHALETEEKQRKKTKPSKK